MANRKISELSAAGALAGNELVEVVKGGVNVQTTTQDIANLAPGGGGGSWGTIPGTLSDQTDLQNALNDKADAGVTTVTDTGAYTLQASDLTLINAGATLIIDGDGTGDLTVPLNATVAFPVGTMIGVRDYDNIVATGGVTITGSSGSLAIPSGMTATLEKTGTNTWLLHNGQASGGGSFASLTGAPEDNAALDAALDAKAPLASPTLTGTPAAPTAAANTNTTQIATTAYVQTELNDKADALITLATKTASHTLDATDLSNVNSGKSLVIVMNVASANDLTIPLNTTQAFAIGTIIGIRQKGAGQTTIVATGGVTLNAPLNAFKLAAQNAIAFLEKTGTDEWYLNGETVI